MIIASQSDDFLNQQRETDTGIGQIMSSSLPKILGCVIIFNDKVLISLEIDFHTHRI